MTDTATTIFLQPKQFRERETPLLADREFTLSTLRYESGVCALRLRNSRGEIVLLPYQGQQIWSAQFDGRELNLVSPDAEPSESTCPARSAFLAHCGLSSMILPKSDDNHTTPGELSNAPYQRAELMVGLDERGRYMAITGRYHHTVAYGHNYLAIPQVRLYAKAALLEISLRITNLKKSPMELMYQACVNFRPVASSRIVDTSLPAINQPANAQTFTENTEQLLSIDYLPSTDGWARSLQVHPDGTADLLRHRPDQLPYSLRWLCRTNELQALGFEPATAEHPGYASTPGKSRTYSLEDGETFQCDLQVGLLNRKEAEQEIDLVEQLIKSY